MRYVVVTPEDQPDTYLVYYMVPSRNTLVASRSQSGGRDRFGSKYPAGDWCADGYRLGIIGIGCTCLMSGNWGGRLPLPGLGWISGDSNR